MKKMVFIQCFVFLFLSVQLNAQENLTAPVQTDVLSAGLGIGQDYGGLGVHMIGYPQRNIGIFGGLGATWNDMGYNVGLKLRLLSRKPTAILSPYVLGMYGYNAVVKVPAWTVQFDKSFYGPTLGMGLDLKFKPMSKFIFSLGLNIPIRGSEVDDYINDLRTNWSLDVSNDLPAVTFSIGVKQIILRK